MGTPTCTVLGDVHNPLNAFVPPLRWVCSAGMLENRTAGSYCHWFNGCNIFCLILFFFATKYSMKKQNMEGSEIDGCNVNWIGERREEDGSEGGGGGVRLGGHVCRRDKTASFLFDWQARGGLCGAPTDTHTPLLQSLTGAAIILSGGHCSLSLPPSSPFPSVTCFYQPFLLPSCIFRSVLNSSVPWLHFLLSGTLRVSMFEKSKNNYFTDCVLKLHSVSCVLINGTFTGFSLMSCKQAWRPKQIKPHHLQKDKSSYETWHRNSSSLQPEVLPEVILWVKVINN